MQREVYQFRAPSFRKPLDVLFLLTCVGLTAEVLLPEIFGRGKSKDYPLWYEAGQQVLHGASLYPSDPNAYFSFIYPPVAAILLAIPSWFGKIPLYFLLCLLNSAAWWMTGQFSNAMTGTGREPGPWLAALPGFATLTYIYDMFDLGQPNLVLLALMLGGFWLLQHRRPIAAGSLFALATAIKVFPIAVLPYLVWRRHWLSAASVAAFLGIFLVLVPAPIRGAQRNIDELVTYARGMIGTSSEKGFGQRDTQNWSWVNQSVIAVTHRLVRPVNFNQDDVSKPPQTMNIVSVDFKTANAIVVIVMALIGLGFIAVLPRRANMTPRSTAAELGILFCLMTIASPLARQYYFIWLYFPMTVLMHRAAFDPRERVRRLTWLTLMVAGALQLLSLPIFPKLFQALGNNLAATFVLIGALIWHMRNPPASSQVEAAVVTT